MSNNQDTNMGVISYRQEELEKKLNSLTDSVIGITKTAELNNLTMRLMQQRVDSLQATTDKHDVAIEQNRTDRNKIQGGWIVLSGVGGAALGGIGVAVTIYQILKPNVH